MGKSEVGQKPQVTNQGEVSKGQTFLEWLEHNWDVKVPVGRAEVALRTGWGACQQGKQ